MKTLKLNVNEMAEYVINELNSNEKIVFRFASSNYNEYRLCKVDLEDLIQRVAIVMCQIHPDGWVGSKSHLNNLIYKKYNNIRIDMMREAKAMTRGFDLEVLASERDAFSSNSWSWIDEDDFRSSALNSYLSGTACNTIDGALAARDIDLILSDIELAYGVHGLKDYMKQCIESGKIIKLPREAGGAGVEALASEIFKTNNELVHLIVDSGSQSPNMVDNVIELAKLSNRSGLRERPVIKKESQEDSLGKVLPMFTRKNIGKENELALMTSRTKFGEVTVSVDSSGDINSDKIKLEKKMKSELKKLSDAS